MYGVPQFIDVEDKVAGPLTWKQLGWILATGVLIAIVFFTVGGALAFVIAIPLILFAAALAFYRPGGMTFSAYITNFITFLFRPKFMIWDRPISQVSRPKLQQQAPTGDTATRTRVVTLDEIRNLAAMVDRK
jgi:hypothetical protein